MVISNNVGKAIITEANERMKRANNKMTPFDICVIALKHSLSFKQTCQWLEKNNVLPLGVYDSLVAHGYNLDQAMQFTREKLTKLTDVSTPTLYS